MNNGLWQRTGWSLIATALAAGCGGMAPENGKATGLDDETAKVASALAALPAAAATTTARQLAPLSGSLAGASRPVFTWTGPGAGAIQVCSDHACQHTIAAFVGTGHSGRPRNALPVGVVYWRLVTLGKGLAVNLSPTWELFVSAGHAANPTATRGLRYDADADGYPDAAVREWSDQTATDLVHVFAGGVGGLSAARQATVPLDTVDFRGFQITAAGDVNGDGYGDLAVTDGVGVSLYAGSATGILATPLSVTPAPAGDPGWPFGASLAALGDVNGDGYGDLAVGDGFSRKVWVFLGGTAGFGAVADWVRDRSAETDGYVRLLTSGDLDGDGHGDLVLGEYGTGQQGFRYFRGRAGGLESSTAGTYVSRPNFPRAVAGDVDGDGTVDLVTSEANAFALFHGGAGFPGAPIQTVPLADDSLPIQLGDFDGDGDADLVASVFKPSAIMYYTNERIDIYPSGPSGLATAPTQTIAESDVLPNNELNFGSSLGFADFDRDGREDLLVGAPPPTPAPLSVTASSVFVFPGTPTGVSVTPAPRLDGPLGFGAATGAGSPTSNY